MKNIIEVYGNMPRIAKRLLDEEMKSFIQQHKYFDETKHQAVKRLRPLYPSVFREYEQCVKELTA